MLELVDADGGEGRHDSRTGTFLRHLLGGAAERPSAPVEAGVAYKRRAVGMDFSDGAFLPGSLRRLAPGWCLR
jgi:hypothetical protein